MHNFFQSLLVYTLLCLLDIFFIVHYPSKVFVSHASVLYWILFFQLFLLFYSHSFSQLSDILFFLRINNRLNNFFLRLNHIMIWVNVFFNIFFHLSVINPFHFDLLFFERKMTILLPSVINNLLTFSLLFIIQCLIHSLKLGRLRFWLLL